MALRWQRVETVKSPALTRFKKSGSGGVRRDERHRPNTISAKMRPSPTDFRPPWSSRRERIAKDAIAAFF
jgi:hypothetical protein